MKVFLTFAGSVSLVIQTVCLVVCCCVVSVPQVDFFVYVCLNIKAPVI